MCSTLLRLILLGGFAGLGVGVGVGVVSGLSNFTAGVILLEGVVVVTTMGVSAIGVGVGGGCCILFKVLIV